MYPLLHLLINHVIEKGLRKDVFSEKCGFRIFQKRLHAFQLDLALKDENGGDISSFISNGEWDLIGVYIQKVLLF